MWPLLAAAAAAAGAAAPPSQQQPVADGAFAQVSSARFHTNAPHPTPAERAPFPTLPFSVRQLLTPPASASPAEGSVWALTTLGDLVSVNAAGATARVLPAACPSGESGGEGPGRKPPCLAATTATGIALVSGTTVRWLKCGPGAVCKPRATAHLPPSWASEVAASAAEPCLVAGDGDALWLGSGAALYAAAPGAPVARQSVPGAAAGGVTSLAFADSTLAIGTPAAVFRCVLPAHSAHPSEADCTHQLVTAVIDWVPTALAFGTDSSLWIGNNFSVSVWAADHTVSRLSGEQGLPTASVTTMVASPTGGVWTGHGAGVSLHAGAFGAPTTEPRGPWRYFYKDRYLPGDGPVIALALPHTTAANRSPHAAGAWVATESGLALISSREETLGGKEPAMRALLQPLDRYGWHGPTASLAEYGNASSHQVLGTQASFPSTFNDGPAHCWVGQLLGRAGRPTTTGCGRGCY